jgi:hypothetical protein
MFVREVWEYQLRASILKSSYERTYEDKGEKQTNPKNYHEKLYEYPP